VFHADESHIGKQLRCTTRDCGEVITIDRQDDHHKYSERQLETVTTGESEVVTPIEARVNAPIVPRSKRRRIAFAFAVVVLRTLAVGTSGYLIGVRRQQHKASSNALVELSPDEVEVAGSDAAPRDQKAPSPQSRAESQRNDSPSSANNPLFPPAPPANPFYLQQTVPSERSGGQSRAKLCNIALQQAPTLSLPTGTRIIPDEAAAGNGQLEAINGTLGDAVVKVVDRQTNRRVREISVQAESSFLMEHLDTGRYKIVFAMGMDWNDQAEHFNRDASYFEFGKTLDFKQYQTSDEVHYERHTITLHAVPDGNVRRSNTEAEFHALSGER